ncbi:MAG: rhodanese-like domain-containing protein [Erysipelotrichia bacterium]|nr:rhodanese-like domain-containing protein [Erysipelotrichia bacterium]NCC55099.1 rhodanese-like domain-containing protein [Erysipelotrichia bacterium]
MKKLILVMIACFAIISGCSSSENGGHVSKIDSDEALRLMEEEKAVLLDVRTKTEYEDGHIEHAILLSLNDIEEKVEGMVQDKKMPVIVYCRSGNRSATAANTLVELGYEKVYDLGGITDWKYEIVK